MQKVPKLLKNYGIGLTLVVTIDIKMSSHIQESGWFQRGLSKLPFHHDDSSPPSTTLHSTLSWPFASLSLTYTFATLVVAKCSRESPTWYFFEETYTHVCILMWTYETSEKHELHTLFPALLIVLRACPCRVL